MPVEPSVIYAAIGGLCAAIAVLFGFIRAIYASTAAAEAQCRAQLVEVWRRIGQLEALACKRPNCLQRDPLDFRQNAEKEKTTKAA